MNDRFKFRFWDKKEKEYFTCGDIDHKSGIFKTYPYRTYNWCFEHKNIIAEQCTGLKDKNGKLIYEGDLVTNGADVFEVVWDYNAWVAQTKKFQEFLSEDYEIIGNIHENRELLDD